MQPDQPISELGAKSPNKKKWFLTIFSIVILGAGLIAILALGAPSGESKNVSIVQPNAKVVIDAKGFEPAVVQVSTGDTVEWINQDSKAHQVATDPFPAEDALAGFVSKIPQLKNESYFYTFKKAGTYSYHDHLSPMDFKGTVIVK